MLPVILLECQLLVAAAVIERRPSVILGCVLGFQLQGVGQNQFGTTGGESWGEGRVSARVPVIALQSYLGLD